MFSQFRRNFSTSKCNSYKVTLYGASGSVGETMSMLLKLNPLVTDLRLYDVSESVNAIALDASHIEYPSEVSAHHGEKSIKNALKDVDIVVFTAGTPSNPGMSSDDIFKKNAPIAKTLADAAAEVCPKALILTITDPIHSLVPLIIETMKKHCVECVEKRVFGVTTVDNVRANTILSKKLCVPPKHVNVPIIGGHTPETMVPVFSKAIPKVCLSQEELEALTCEIQQADNVIKQKAGKAASPNLTKCYASARFINSMLCALKGDQNIIDCTFLKSDFCPVLDYFAGPVTFGKEGAECACKIHDLSDLEKKLLAKAVPILQQDVQKGIEFAQAKECKPEPKKEDKCEDDKKKTEKKNETGSENKKQSAESKKENSKKDPGANKKKNSKKKAGGNKKKDSASDKKDKKTKK